MKICTKCNKKKEESEFYKSVCKSGLSAKCKKCCISREKELKKNKSKEQLEKDKLYHINYNTKYKINNIEQYKKTKKENKYKEKISGKHAEYSRARRAKQMSADSGTINIENLNNLLEIQNKRCYYCYISLDDSKHLDHYIPLSKGGKHCISNVVWSCPKCNLKKNDKIPFTDYPILKREFLYDK